MKIQHKRSNQLDGDAAKAPSAEFMEYGELAVNFNQDDPAIFIKDSGDQVIRIAGAGSSGVGDGKLTVNDGDGNTLAEFTANQTGDVTCEIPNQSWSQITDKPIYIQTETPDSPSNGDIWVDLNECPPELKIWSDCSGTGQWETIEGTPPITFDASITDSGAGGNVVGQTLTAVAANIAGGTAPVEYAYQWYSDGAAAALPGGAQKEKEILNYDIGRTITCEITVAEPDGSNAVTKTATYGKTPEAGGVINKPTVLTPPDGAGIGGDVTYTPKTSAITNVSGDTLTLTNSNTYDNADGSNVGTPISQTFLAGQTVSGVSATGTYGTDAPVFSTTLYTGNGTTQTITNGIDLAGQGGLVWLKTRARSVADFYSNHFLYDSERGLNDSSYLHTNTKEPQGAMGAITPAISFLSDGFTAPGTSNSNNDTFVSWTFRKAPGFFDIVTYTGTGHDDATISHSLGSEPGMIIVKNLTKSTFWACYSKGCAKFNIAPINPNYAYLTLNDPAGVTYFPGTNIWDVSSTSFNASATLGLNNNEDYVAYLFADTPGKTKIGTYTGNGSSQTIECGFEPQWVMIKAYNEGGPIENTRFTNWIIADNKRPSDAPLAANLNQAEKGTDIPNEQVEFTSSGFTLPTGRTSVNGGFDYTYFAIAKDVVAGEFGPTGTLTADADDAGPTITLSGVTGTWAAGMEVVSDTEITEFAPDADDLEFTSSVPSGTNITTYAFATWEVDTDSLFGSPMTTSKAMTAGVAQELLPSERGEITLAADTDYHVRVKYTSGDPASIESQYSDANHFKTNIAGGQDDWNLESSGIDSQWGDVAFGNGVFVAVAFTGTNRVMYSSDGISWTGVDVGTDMQFQSVAFGNNRFVAVSNAGSQRAMYSTNGIDWTKVDAISESWIDVKYIGPDGNKKFVACASGFGTFDIMHSADGVSWTSASTGFPGSFLQAVAYGDSKYVAVSNNQFNYQSTDLTNWTQLNRGDTFRPTDAVFADNKFVIVGATEEGVVLHSANGTDWSAGTGGQQADALVYGDSKFVAVSINSNNFMYSADGENWSLVAAPKVASWSGVAYGNGIFVAVDYTTTGTDDVSWSETGEGDPAAFIAYDADNNKPVNDLNIVDRFGVDPTADNTYLGIYELTNQPTDAVAAYVPEGDKYKPIIDLSQPLEQAQAEAAQANARLDEANATIETMRSNFEARISALESES